MKIGVKRGTVRLQEYTTAWKDEYHKEKLILLDIFGENYLEMEHIGSTAIPNLIAKPLIDIAIKVKDINNLDPITKNLIKIGYIERLGRLNGKQKVFAKGGDLNVTHHLHIIEQDEVDWEEKIRFKNILISNPKIVNKYAELKRKLTSDYQDNRSKYTKIKSQFIRKILDEKYLDS